jgi:uncharacterized protein (TIGR04255 family)
MSDSVAQNSKFRPVNNAHAIAEVIFYCVFSPDFDNSVINRLINLRDIENIKSFLPKERLIKGALQNIDLDSLEKTRLTVSDIGIELQRINPDGTMSWMLRTTSNSISVHCLNYTRWNEVWEKARNFLHIAFNQIGVSSNLFSSVGLQYIDRFEFIGNPSDYNSELLLKRSDYVHNKAFCSAERWHCNIGWFDKFDEQSNNDNFKFECLNQLDLVSGYGQVSGSKRIMVTISHNQVISLLDSNDDIDVLSFGGDAPSQEDSLLNKTFAKLHQNNKQLLLDILTDDIAKQINLDI